MREIHQMHLIQLKLIHFQKISHRSKIELTNIPEKQIMDHNFRNSHNCWNCGITN